MFSSKKKIDKWIEIGDDYYKGRNGKAKDFAQAFEFYLKAANKGNHYSMAQIGFMYEYGEGVEKDESAALKWYIAASYENGAIRNSFACYRAGLLYYYGHGTPVDYEKAFQYFRYSNFKAAKFGEAAYLQAKLLWEKKVKNEMHYNSVVGYLRTAAGLGHKKAEEALPQAEKEEKAKQAAKEQADKEARTAVCPWCNVTLTYTQPLKENDILKHNECGRHFRYFDKCCSAPYGMEKCAPEPGVDPTKACPKCGKNELSPVGGGLYCGECAFSSVRSADKREQNGIFDKIEYGNYARLLDVPCPHCGKERRVQKPSDLGWGSGTSTCENCGKEYEFE